jgi:hypothetical protein
MFIGSSSGDGFIIYLNFSEITASWPTEIKINGQMHQFRSQEYLDLHESGVFAGKATYAKLNDA